MIELSFLVKKGWPGTRAQVGFEIFYGIEENLIFFIAFDI